MGRQLDVLTRLFAALVPTTVAACEAGIDESQFSDDLCDDRGYRGARPAR